MMFPIRWSRAAPRLRRAFALTAIVPLTIVFWPFASGTAAIAKTPGKTYCFNGYCHRVLTLAETRAQIGQRKTVTASHYGHCKQDRYNPCGLTSSGAVFQSSRDDNAASPIYPNGTKILVWNPATKRAAIVRINNAGPYWGTRTLDLSRAAAGKLGFAHRGVARLWVQVISAPTLREATYRRHRIYPAVPGYIGQFPTLASAERATVGAAPITSRIAAKVILPAKQPVAKTLSIAAVALAPPLPAQRLSAKPSITIAAQSGAQQYLFDTAMVELPTRNPTPDIPYPDANRPLGVRLPAQLVRAARPTPVRLALERRTAPTKATAKRPVARSKETANATNRHRRKNDTATRTALSARNTSTSNQARKSDPVINRKPASQQAATQKPAQQQAPVVTTSATQNRGTNEQSTLPTATTTAATPAARQTRLAWRQKYFSMNRGGA